MRQLTDDTLRGLAVGGMVAVGAGALFVFFVGGLIEGEDPSGATGDLVRAAGLAGLATALIAAHAVVRGARARAAIAAILQAAVAVLVLGWWVAADFWSGTAHANLSVVPLALTIVVDAVVVLWARLH